MSRIPALLRTPSPVGYPRFMPRRGEKPPDVLIAVCYALTAAGVALAQLPPFKLSIPVLAASLAASAYLLGRWGRTAGRWGWSEWVGSCALLSIIVLVLAAISTKPLSQFITP